MRSSWGAVRGKLGSSGGGGGGFRTAQQRANACRSAAWAVPLLPPPLRSER